MWVYEFQCLCGGSRGSSLFFLLFCVRTVSHSIANWSAEQREPVTKPTENQLLYRRNANNICDAMTTTTTYDDHTNREGTSTAPESPQHSTVYTNHPNWMCPPPKADLERILFKIHLPIRNINIQIDYNLTTPTTSAKPLSNYRKTRQSNTYLPIEFANYKGRKKENP